MRTHNLIQVTSMDQLTWGCLKEGCTNFYLRKILEELYLFSIAVKRSLAIFLFLVSFSTLENTLRLSKQKGRMQGLHTGKLSSGRRKNTFHLFSETLISPVCQVPV